MNALTRALALTVILCALLPAAAHGDDHANVARGFNSDSTFQLGELDNVNIFSGNLILTLPIGQTYHVGGDLSYALKLVYNGQLWSYRNDGAAVPSRSNVALGWQLTLGDLQAPQARLTEFVDPQLAWSFIGSDGARHTFYRVLHGEEVGSAYEALHGNSPVLGYTRDGSIMRLVHVAWVAGPDSTKVTRRVRVEMPNGLIYQFRSATLWENSKDVDSLAAPYYLEKVVDAYGNTLRVEYWWTDGGTSTRRWNPAAVELQKLVELPASIAPAVDESVPYENDSSQLCATCRTQIIEFQEDDWQNGHSLQPTVRQRIIRNARLTAKGGAVANYNFTTEYAGIGEPCDSRMGVFDDHITWIRLLTTVTNPDGTKYGFTYQREGTGNGDPDHPENRCSRVAGHMLTFSPPLGGSIAYTPTRRQFPQTPESVHLNEFGIGDKGSPAEGMPPFANPTAVSTRTIIDLNGNSQTWSYSSLGGCWPPGNLVNGSAHVRPQVEVVDVHDPEGVVTRSHFATDLFDDDDELRFKGKLSDYALPFNGARPFPIAAESGYFLSTEILDRACELPVPAARACDFTACDGRVMRRTYVKYEVEPFIDRYATGPEGAKENGGNTDLNRRLRGTIAVTRKYDAANDAWIDDTSCGGQLCYSKVEYDDYDALGHFRKETRSTNMGGATRTTTTSYDPLMSHAGHTPATYVIGGTNAPGSYMLGMSDLWLNGFFRDIGVSEGGSDVTLSQPCWDFNTGFMKRNRMLRDSTNSVLSVFTETDGNLTSESYVRLNGAFDICNSEPPPAETTINHTWSAGSLATSKYAGVDFKSRDFGIDPSTGLAITSRDAANRLTSYDYDIVGRLTEIRPPHAMWTKYEYGLHNNFSTEDDDQPVNVTARMFAFTDPAGTNPLGESRFYYDHLGRLIQTKRRMPDGYAAEDPSRTLLVPRWSTIGQTYDSTGRKKTVTVAKYESNPDYSISFDAPKTSFVYDALGRTTSTIAPDGAVATAEYSGAQTVRKTVKVATSLSDPAVQTPFTTTEAWDGFGRLASVQEAITGSPVTSYGYDIGDRLATVTSGVQQRMFLYDISGLLKEETHPESATVKYTYDARGHMLTRDTGTLFSLSYGYDAAERPTTVTDEKNQKLLKEFKYDSFGGVTEPGRLVYQSRINPFGAQQYVVSDSFHYDDAGRLSSKTTSVSTPTDATQGGPKTFSQAYSYNDQDQLDQINYPVCANCPNLATGLRNVPMQWTNGLLTSITGAANRIEYGPSGEVTRVEHYAANAPTGVIDTDEQDPTGMPRPSRITFKNVIDCELITRQPASVEIHQGDIANFSIETVAGVSVQWYEGPQGNTTKPLTTGPSLTTVPLTASTSYWARVTNADGCIEDSVTVTANVCAAPVFLSPAQDATTNTIVSVNLDRQFSVDVDVAPSEVIWYKRLLNSSDADKVEIGRGLSIHYKPLEVTAASNPLLIIASATNACGTNTKRTVARLEVRNEQCSASWIAQLPTKAVSVMPLEPMQLLVRMEWVPGATYSFRWYEDDELVQSNDLPSTPTFSLVDSSYMFRVATQSRLRVDAWVNCADGQQSPKITSSSYGLLYGRCPIPELTLSQTNVVATAQPVVITADVPWPDATFQWYEGETGNTRFPLGYATTNVLTADPIAATYWLRASTDCGTFTDSPTVRISTASCTPVRITRDPADVTTAAGAEVVLSVDAQSVPSPTKYDWHRNNIPIADAENRPSITIRPLRTADYHVRVRNDCHITESRIARVHVTSCASITLVSQPQDVSVATGASAHLQVRATAALPLHYQWYEGESGDATHPVGTDDDDFDPIGPSTTKYWVRISFADPALCAIDSRTASVTVCGDAAIFRVPGPEVVSSVPGIRQAFDVGVSGANVSYQWYEGTALALPPTGPDNTDYSKPLNSTSNALAVSPQVTTNYFVKVTTTCSPHGGRGYVNVPVRVSVCPNITEQPTAANTLIVSGTTTTLSILNIDRGDSVQWYTRAANGTVTIVLSMTGNTATTPPLTQPTTFFARATSGYCSRDSETITINICTSPVVTFDASSITKVEKDQQFTLIAGVRPSDGVANYAWYRGTVSGDVANSTLISTSSNVLNTTISQTTSYWVRATTPDGCYADTPVHTVQVCIPKITSQPQSITISANSSTTLTVVADVTSTYQWYKGQPGDTSQPVAGQTASSITVTPAVDTTYWVRVTGGCQISKDSTAATVTICQPPQITAQPSSQSIAYSYTVNPAVTATGTDLSYQWYKGISGDTTTPIAGATSASVAVTPTVTTDYWVKITGHCGTLNSQTAKISVAPSITTQPVGGSITKGTTRTLTVAASGTQLTYQWIKLVGSTENPVAGATAASYTTPAITNDSIYFCRVSSGNAIKDSSVATLTVCLARTVRIVGTPNKVSGSTVTLTVDDASAEETYYWYRGISGDTSNSIGQGVTRTVSPLETTLYWARTHTAACDADSAELTVRICYPAITAQPQSATIASGTTRQLTVAATGTPAMTYQWYIGAPGNTASPIAGATSASYTTPALTTTTSYWARVSCPSAGCTSSWTDSAGATVTVCQPPAITTHPGPHITVKNDTLTLNVVATGDGLHYQWYEGPSGDVSHPVGTDAASYTFTTTTTKYFWVRVSGTCGTVDSNAAQQSIYPTINGQPQAATICGLGSSATFSVNAAGAETYQWWRQVTGQTKVAVGTTASVSVPIAQVPVQVWVDVTSGLATTSSSHVGVSVNPVPTVNSFTSTVDNPQGTRFLLQANIAAADQGLVKFKFYQGQLGDTSTQLYDGTAYYFRVTPASHPMTYWVRVYYIDTGCPTDRAVTIP